MQQIRHGGFRGGTQDAANLPCEFQPRIRHGGFATRACSCRKRGCGNPATLETGEIRRFRDARTAELRRTHPLGPAIGTVDPWPRGCSSGGRPPCGVGPKGWERRRLACSSSRREVVFGSMAQGKALGPIVRPMTTELSSSPPADSNRGRPPLPLRVLRPRRGQCLSCRTTDVEATIFLGAS